jgi:CheY-like chemotaxis protein
MPTILIVEDDHAAREGLCELLTGAGFSVTAARDGAEALTQLEEQRFDVMLLDIWLPKISGLELLGRLSHIPDLPKIIVMTGDDTPETLLLTMRKQAHQFVKKPIEIKALLALIRSTVASPPGEAVIVVLSARPAWVELLVSCGPGVADRIQSYIVNLDVDLPREIREPMGRMFRELLLDAMEWDGHLDPKRKVRIAYLRARKMLLYRIADAEFGFRSSDQSLAAARHTDASLQSDGHGGSNLLRPGALLARAEADELLFNEAQNEVVVVKYLD